MSNIEKGQLYIDDWKEEPEEEKDEKSSKEKPFVSEEDDDERDCPSCGGSGSCSSCERGRAWAKEQGYTFRTSSSRRRRR